MLAHFCQLPEGTLVSLDELFAVGWPSEAARSESRRKRVHTAIWTLRRAGAPITTVRSRHYCLDATVVECTEAQS
ncbi:MAG: hypothetical protein AAF645_24935 [Myxococcota bacterium]